MNINIAEEKSSCVALGLGTLIANPELLKRLKINED